MAVTMTRVNKFAGGPYQSHPVTTKPGTDAAMASDVPSVSWSDRLPPTEHVAFFKRTDWALTPLGSLESWDSTLRFATYMVFNDCRPTCVYWGPQNIAIYNEQFIDIAAGAHPILMGNSFRVGFPTALAEMQPLFDRALHEGKGVEFPRMELSLVRHKGFLEESFFMGQLIPIYGDGNKPEGVYSSGYENTSFVLYERRRDTLNALSAIPDSRLSQLFPLMTEVLETNGRDISMVLVYSANEGAKSDPIQVELVTSIGVPDDHTCAPSTGILGETTAGFFPLIKKAKEAAKALFLSSNDGTFEDQLIGFMVIATNPRRDWDGSSAQFVHDLTQQIVVKWGSAITTENAAKREETLAKKLRATEERIRRMAECAPVGMIQLNLEGEIEWANEQWYEITSHPRDSQFSQSWTDCYDESSRKRALIEWENLLKGFNTSCESKLNRRFNPPVRDEIEHNIWVNALGFPLLEDGEVKYIMGTLTDVSHLKWAESVQARSASMAEKAKRQQEEFIDMTSHEMRNPLSAIYQCASMISASLSGVAKNVEDLVRALESNVETANTILTCAAHQKRIIDDVLILNRLENTMLSITPVPVTLPDLLDHVLKIFHVELATDDIDLQIVRHPSYDVHNVELVLCDPSRLTQIFINLISNAIKFTRTRKERRIILRYRASLTQPDEVAATMKGGKLHWSPTLKHHEDLTTGKDWENGEPLFLRSALEDTGPGLEAVEIERLFNRFSQANAKTHITYGGSGLGLYISRKLAEKQGGRIGIASTPDVGTTIAFNVKTRRGQPEILETSLEEHGTSNKVVTPSSPRGEKRLKTTNAGQMTVPQNRAATSGDNHMGIQTKETRTINVLLAEDNLINQKILRKQLRNIGYEVHVANHGLEVLDFLRKSSCWTESTTSAKPGPSVDIILMDWEMPLMDGIECSKEIRTLERGGKLSHLPIIAITANARNEQIQTALSAGIDDVLTKPFLVPQLVERIAKWVQTPS